MSFLDTTRESYDAVVADHVERVRSGSPLGRWLITENDFAGQPPLARALMGAFAELVAAGGGGPVADVGCGAGGVTKGLADLGLEPVGIDLSPQMVALARERYPALAFEVGSMLSLDLRDGSVAGVVANNSIIHVPWEFRSQVFAEFHRVLRPDGQLLVTFPIGDERRHHADADGVPISLDWYRQQPDEVDSLLKAAGFRMRVRAVEDPVDGRPAHGYVLAFKPSGD
jgi:SAM-dependent methyltransferase